MRLSIQEALSMMVGAYTNLEGAQLTLMEALVGSYLVKVRAHCQAFYNSICMYICYVIVFGHVLAVILRIMQINGQCLKSNPSKKTMHPESYVVVS